MFSTTNLLNMYIVYIQNACGDICIYNLCIYNIIYMYIYNIYVYIIYNLCIYIYIKILK